jgi:predicted PurR-regulated permease PerM
MRARTQVSLAVLIAFLVGVVTVRYEMCTCPSHWAFLSLFGFIALACGPHVYRFLGLVAIGVALVLTYQARQTQIELSKRSEALMKSGPSDHK